MPDVRFSRLSVVFVAPAFWGGFPRLIPDAAIVLSNYVQSETGVADYEDRRMALLAHR